ncbi:hypothetical protein PM082_019010 [Marasmius tenuissimus]|nr:hypothetical protein PM082_019010 [Marasmius tenuissimus]
MGPAMLLPTPPNVPSTPMYTPITFPHGISPTRTFHHSHRSLSHRLSRLMRTKKRTRKRMRVGSKRRKDELGNLLAVASLTLANLTKNEKEREKLCARTEKEGGRRLSLGEEMAVVVS